MHRNRLIRAAAALTAVAATALAALPTPSSAASLPTLTISLTGKSVTVGGTETSGAVNVLTTVTGAASGEPTLALLKPGVSASTFLKIGSAAQDANAIDPYGTIVFDADASAGKSSAQTVLRPGNYVAFNFATGGHAFAAFTITPSTTLAVLPKPQATISAIDFGFRGASTIHHGELVRFQNDGYLIHMIGWARVKTIADANRVKALLLAGKAQQAAHKYAIGQGMFAGALSTGGMQQLHITESPGVYILFCSMNTQDGRDHYQLGMFRTIKINK